jgi:hypothetical protein
MGEQYNPENRTDNCGFCSISRAIHEKSQGGRFVNADTLYDQTLLNLRIQRLPNGGDPISRMLLLPERDSDNIPLPTSHEALREVGRSACDYMVESVGEALGLPCVRDTYLKNTLTRFIGLSRDASGPRRFHVLAEERLDGILQSESSPQSRRATPSIQRVEEHLRTALAKQFIIGLHKGHRVNHFINLTIDLSGRVEAYDAQINMALDPNLILATGTIKAVTSVNRR